VPEPADRRPPSPPRDLPPYLKAAFGAATLAALLAGLSQVAAWIAVATGAFVVGVMVLHRWVWRWPPRTWAVGVLLPLTVAGGVIGHLLSSDDTTRTKGAATASAASTTAPHSSTTGSSSSGATAGPELNDDATCASVQGASDDGDQLHTIYAGSPGQLQAGSSSLVGRMLPKGAYSQVVHVASGDRIGLSAELNDTAYGDVNGVHLKAIMNPYGANCWRLWVRTSSAQPGGNVKLGPALVVWKARRATQLTYVPGSTVLLNAKGRVLAHLQDGITGTGTALPYAVGPSTMFVNFELEVR
jgi:hypothetical protein